MAQISYLVFSPNALVSLYGLLHGPDRTVATPAQDWHQAVVDVVIPALNEEATITLCLASIKRQTFKPRQIILIDDGSTDRTVEYAQSYAKDNDLQLTVIRRAHPIGKTPTIKRQAREYDPDVEFILDGDTALESDNYIERTVQELYQGAGIASACGTILPLRLRDRDRMADWPDVSAFRAMHPDAPLMPEAGLWHRLRRGITNMYRESLYLFLQKFVYRGQMVMFGTITNPVGCAVAYRRQYVKDLFDKYEPVFGDDLTNSEDIFIGFAMLAEGYRNIQLEDVYARSMEPEAQRLPRQVYMWSSSFLQSCYYFDVLLRSPFKFIKRWRHERETRKQHAVRELRKIQEPYRQPWGLEYTRKFGRPIGWTLLMALIEKVAFPTALVLMAILGHWEALGLTLAVETILVVGILTIIAKGQRLEFMAKGLLMTPVRYLYILFDIVTIGRFAADLWIRKNRKWRK
jgi:glycosyltransferase involved in cell wall biosynthesis